MGPASWCPTTRRRRPTGSRRSAAPGGAWRRFDAHGRRVWDVAERTFLAGPMVRPARCSRRMQSPRDLLAIDPLRTLHRSRVVVLRRSPARAVGRSLRHVLRVVSVPCAGDAGVHPTCRVPVRLLVPAGWVRRVAGRAATGGGRCRRRGPAIVGRGADRHVGRRRDGSRDVPRCPDRRRRGRRQRRRRAPLPRPVARRPSAAPSPPSTAIDERAGRRGDRAWRNPGHRAPQRVVLRPTSAPSSATSQPGGWPRTRRSMRACRR